MNIETTSARISALLDYPNERQINVSDHLFETSFREL